MWQYVGMIYKIKRWSERGFHSEDKENRFDHQYVHFERGCILYGKVKVKFQVNKTRD